MKNKELSIYLCELQKALAKRDAHIYAEKNLNRTIGELLMPYKLSKKEPEKNTAGSAVVAGVLVFLPLAVISALCYAAAGRGLAVMLPVSAALAVICALLRARRNTAKYNAAKADYDEYINKIQDAQAQRTALAADLEQRRGELRTIIEDSEEYADKLLALQENGEPILSEKYDNLAAVSILCERVCSDSSATLEDAYKELENVENLPQGRVTIEDIVKSIGKIPQKYVLLHTTVEQIENAAAEITNRMVHGKSIADSYSDVSSAGGGNICWLYIIYSRYVSTEVER
ncbi:MAG: hypothetical protein LUE06_07520 [Oscillospiraceae bacterium]|nr:hypothetical protein [Oscillospiraceae bacterium]